MILEFQGKSRKDSPGSERHQFEMFVEILDLLRPARIGAVDLNTLVPGERLHRAVFAHCQFGGALTFKLISAPNHFFLLIVEPRGRLRAADGILNPFGKRDSRLTTQRGGHQMVIAITSNRSAGHKRRRLLMLIDIDALFPERILESAPSLWFAQARKRPAEPIVIELGGLEVLLSETSQQGLISLHSFLNFVFRAIGLLKDEGQHVRHYWGFAHDPIIARVRCKGASQTL